METLYLVELDENATRVCNNCVFFSVDADLYPLDSCVHYNVFHVAFDQIVHAEPEDLI